MRRPLLAAAVAAAIALSLSPRDVLVRAQESELAPEIQISSWIHGDGRDQLADYRGDVVLLEFWNTH